MAKAGSMTVHLNAYVFWEILCPVPNNCFYWSFHLCPYHYFPSFSALYFIFFCCCFFHTSQYFYSLLTLYSIPISFLFSPAINRTLAVTRLLSLLSLSSHVYLPSVCKLSWEETVLLCNARHRPILPLRHDTNKEDS